MCDHCGCSPATGEHNHDDDHDHDDTPGHDHSHDHGHHRKAGRTVDVRESVLAFNDRLAERNRGFFEAKGLFVVNMLSGPGAGKTALIERTIRDCGIQIGIGVIVGDLQTENDAIRIRAAGGNAVQITTGEVCHLDAHMVRHAMEQMSLTDAGLLIIENVGNLVCPAAFDLGEKARVVLLSSTEGEDKPLKYPVMFQRADVVILSKADIAAAVDFDHEKAVHNIREVAPQALILTVSAKTGTGLEAWYDWLKQHVANTAPA